MKTAIVIPTFDAVKRGMWKDVLDAVSRQDLPLDVKIVIDSGSTDQTVCIAEAFRWKVLRVAHRNFDHGNTRARIVRILLHRGFDTVIFLSQDVVLAFPGALTKLTEYLWGNDLAGCYGKQISLHEHSLEAWQRKRCYPDCSRIKCLADTPRLKLLTPFISNAFAAWKTAEVTAYGNFPRTMFGEDMLLAARILEAGGAIGYCAEAIAVHEHPGRPGDLFLRGRAIGRFHREHPELLRRFGKPIPPLPYKDLPRIALPLAVKCLGYFCGRSMG